MIIFSTFLQNNRHKKLIFIILISFTLCLLLYWISTINQEVQTMFSLRLVVNSNPSNHAFELKENYLLNAKLIKDIRPESCKNRNYTIKYERKTAIIITFYNEKPAILIRTITSILDRTKKSLLTEIIVVDDYSDNNDAESLTKILMKLNEKIKIIRNRKREGLIKSRIIGVKQSTGHYIVFLDSHCEVMIDWLEPLFERVQMHNGMIASPILDSIKINEKNLLYKPSNSNLRAGFDWNLSFHWIPMSEMERELRGDISLPFLSPITAGGTFIINREWFNTLNGFDSGLEFWGLESLELSLKTWMCGGQIEIVPCSRIGHIFQKNQNFKFSMEQNYTIMKNKKRVADNWLDDYKFLFYHASKLYENNIEISAKIQEIQFRLQCQSFQWYRENVFPQLKIPVFENYKSFGYLAQRLRCIFVLDNEPILLNKNNSCPFWTIDKIGNLYDIRNNCLVLQKENIESSQITIWPCKNDNISISSEQVWNWKNGKLLHKNSGRCLESQYNSWPNIQLADCKQGNIYQLWRFSIKN